jgi:hypothetical protein
VAQSVSQPEPAAQRARPTAAHERKLVRAANLSLEVESYAAARERIDAELARLGGYVAEARVEHADGAAVSAALELRIPANELPTFMRQAALLGTVQREQVRSGEITEEYYDAQARLTIRRQLEQRLLAFTANQTSDVKALLEVERELGRVREEIELLQGQLAGYDSRVALSSLSLELTSRQRVSMGDPPTLGGQLQHSLEESIGALLGAGRDMLIVLAFLAPWLPLLVLGTYLGRRTLRRAR